MNKRDEDFENARHKRELERVYLNQSLIKVSKGVCFKRLHQYLRTMSINDKSKNNTLKNYVKGSPFYSAMGLHYILINAETGKYVPFIFCYQGHGGIYLKIPKDYRGVEKLYLQLLANLEYRMLVVSELSTDTTRLYSYPVSFQTILNMWKWKMETTKGNKNRMQFYGALSKINYATPHTPVGMESSLVETLVSLVS